MLSRKSQLGKGSTGRSKGPKYFNALTNPERRRKKFETVSNYYQKKANVRGAGAG